MNKRSELPTLRSPVWALAALVSFAACATPGQPSSAETAIPPQKLQRERSEMEQQLQGGPNKNNPTLNRAYGWALLIAGEWRRAEEMLTQASAADPRDARVLLGLAFIAQDLGLHRRSQDLWLRILEGRADAPPTPIGDGKGSAKLAAWADPLAEVAAQRLLVLGTDGGGGEADQRLRQRVLALWSRSASLPLEARQLLGALAGQLLRLGGDEAGAQRVDVERGCPASYYVSGPYGHLPALDLLTPFAADEPGHDPQRDRYQRRSGYGCSIALEGSSSSPGVMYATTWAKATRGGLQPITVESGGAPWALYVDGHLSYLEQDPLRRRHLWLTMPVGWHALVLKVGAAGRVQTQLSAPGLSFYDGPVRSAPPIDASVAVASRRRTLSELPTPQAGWEDVLRALLRGQQAHIIGDSEAGLDAVEPVSASVPRFVALSLLRAALILEDRSRPERLLRDQARNLLEQILKAEPQFLRARLSLATLLMQDEHADQAQELLEAAPQSREPGFAHKLLLYRVLKARGWQIEAERALAEAETLGPSAVAVVEAEVELHREQNDVRGALLAAKKLVALNPYSDKVADDHFDAGRFTEAEHEYMRLLQLEPESDDWQSSLVRVLSARRARGDLERARTLQINLLAQAPRNVTHRVELANLLVDMERRDEAKAVLREGLLLQPESAELARALLALGERGPMDPYRIDGRQVISEFLTNHHGTFDGEPAVLLLDRTVVRVLPTGARLTLTHNIIRVLTKDGLDKFGEVKIPDGAEVLMLRTIKSDGSTREPEEIPEKESVSAPDLEIGDFVEFEYLERESPLAAFPHAFLAERFYFASLDAPLDRSEYILIVPQELQLQIDVRGPLKDGRRDVPVATTRSEQNLRVYTWQRRQAARLRPEPPISEAVVDDWMPSVRVGSGLSFAGYVNYLRERRVRTLRIGRDVRALALKLADGGNLQPSDGSDAPELSPTQIIARARRLDAWVRLNIREGGSIDEQATAVLAKREGRRDVLLMTLLRAAGIPCEMWLVRPQNAAQLDGPLPDLTAYHDVLLAVAPGRGVGGQPLLFLDPSFRHVASGYVRPMLRGARALRLPEPSAAPPLPSVSFADVVLPTEGGPTAAWGQLGELGGASSVALRDGRQLQMGMTLAADGSGEVSVRETLSGGPALEWREHVENLSQEKLRQELEQRALGFYFPGASLLDLKYGPIERDDEPLVIEYRFFAPQLARQRGTGGGELVLPAPYPVLLGRNYIHVARRSTPLLVNYVVPTTLEAQIQLPARAQISQLKPTVDLSDFGHFTQRISTSPGGDRLTLHAEFSLPLTRVLPERYSQFVEFARQIDSVEESIAVIAISP